jgi:hypothetical protein
MEVCLRQYYLTLQVITSTSTSTSTRRSTLVKTAISNNTTTVGIGFEATINVAEAGGDTCCLYRVVFVDAEVKVAQRRRQALSQREHGCPPTSSTLPNKARARARGGAVGIDIKVIITEQVPLCGITATNTTANIATNAAVNAATSAAINAAASVHVEAAVAATAATITVDYTVPHVAIFFLLESCRPYNHLKMLA